jgi:hypothetical protein
MKIQNLFYLCAIFVLSAANSFALGKAASMGNLQTVVPSGPFDTARNPALLATQTSANSTGLFCSYIMHFPEENSVSSNGHYEDTIPTTYSWSSDIKTDDPKISGMSVNIANSTKLANSAIGFAFTNNGNDQYSIEERKISSVTTSNPNSYRDIRSNEKSKKTELNPGFTTSVGFNMSKTSSIGFQILAKYSDSTEKKEYYENRTLPNPPYEKNEKQTREINALSGELGFGYLLSADNTEIGLLIRSGDFSWIKKKLSAKTNRIVAPLLGNFSTEGDTSLNGKHTSGPSITAGGYRRFNSVFAMALESKFTIQNTFTSKELDLDDDPFNVTKVKIKKNTQTTKQSVLFNGGIELDLSKSLSFTSGLGYSEISTETSSEIVNGSQRQGNTMQYLFLTIGLDYILSPNVSMSIIALILPYKLNGYLYNEVETSSMRQEFYYEMESKGYYLHTGLGVTMSF